MKEILFIDSKLNSAGADPSNSDYKDPHTYYPVEIENIKKLTLSLVVNLRNYSLFIVFIISILY